MKTKKLRQAKRQLATEMDKAEKTADAIKADMTLEELFKLDDTNLRPMPEGAAKEGRLYCRLSQSEPAEIQDPAKKEEKATSAWIREV